MNKVSELGLQVETEFGLTEPERPLELLEEGLLALEVGQPAGPQEGAAAAARAGEARAVPVRVLRVGVLVVLVLDEGVGEDLVAELAGEDAEEGAIGLGVARLRGEDRGQAFRRHTFGHGVSFEMFEQEVVV